MSLHRLLLRVLVIIRRLVVSLGLGVTILVLALTVGYIFSGGWVASRLSQIVNQRLFIDRSTRLVVRRVTGSLFSRVVFDGVELDRRVGDTWSPSVRADRVEAAYNLLGLLRGRRELAYVAVTGPRLDVAQDSAGAWVLPVGAVGPAGGRRASAADVKVDRVLIRRGLLRLSTRDRGYAVDSLDLSASLRVKGSQVVIDVAHGAFTMAPPVGRVEGLAGQLQVDGRRVQARGAQFVWEGSSVGADFSYDPADSLHGLSGDLRVTHLPLGRLKGLIDSELLPERGEATGGVHLAGGLAGCDFRVNLGGTYSGQPVDTLRAEGRWTPGRVDVRRLRLDTPRLDLAAASGRVELTRGLRIAADLSLNHAQLDSLPLKAVAWIPGYAAGRISLDIRNLRHGFGPTAGIVDADLGVGRAFGIDLAGARAHIDFEDDRDARLTGVELRLAGGGTVTGEGRVLPGHRLDFTFAGESGDWTQVRPLVAVPGLAGAGRFTGRLTGLEEAPELELSGAFTRAAGWEVTADSLRLERLAGPFLPPAHLAGTLSATGVSALGRVFDRMELDYDWREPRLTFPRLKAVQADTLIETRGTADFDAARNTSHTVLADGTLTMGGLTWVPEGPLTVDGAGERYDVLPVAVRSPAGRTVVAATFQNDRGTMDFRLSDMDLDVVVLAGERKAPELKSARLTGAVRLTGPNLLPDISGRIGLRDYRWADAVLDSAGIDFTTFGPTVRVDDAWAVSGPGRLTATGTAGLTGPAWRVWNLWLAQKPVPWGHTRLSEVRLEAHELDVARWAAWNPQLRELHGTGSGTLRLDGRMDTPDLDLTGRLTKLRFGADGVDSLDLALTYAADSLHVERLHAARGGATLDLAGRLPVHMALYPPAGELQERPMDLRVDLPRTDISIFPFLGRQLDVAAGFLAGRLRVQGTRRAPLVYGDLTLADGRFRLKGREELFERVYARARFDGGTVHVDTLRAFQGAEGRLLGHGTFELGEAPTDAYRLTLDASKLVVRQSGDYAVQFDGRFDVTPLTLSGGSVRPMTTGNVTISRAEIVRPLNRPQATPEPGQDFYFRIGIDAPGRVFVVNDLVDMELRGNLTASKTPEGTALTGELEILKGYYSVVYRRFRVTSGRLTFNKYDVIDPQIDITAETQTPDHTFRILITGQASNPVIHFEAEPADLSEEEIRNRLAPGGSLVNQQGGFDRGQAAALGVNVLSSSVQALLQQVQRELTGKLGLIDELRLDPATDPNSVGRIIGTRYLTNEINVSYSQGLGGSLEQGLSAEYRLGRLLFLHGEFIRRRPTSDDPRGEEYNLDLQFFHEY